MIGLSCDMVIGVIRVMSDQVCSAYSATYNHRSSLEPQGGRLARRPDPVCECRERESANMVVASPSGVGDSPEGLTDPVHKGDMEWLEFRRLFLRPVGRLNILEPRFWYPSIKDLLELLKILEL